MNTTILLALIIAFAAVFFLKRVAAQLLLRKVGRAALTEVGKRAMARVPQQVSLVKTESPVWNDGAGVEQQAAPLRNEGFKDLGAYSVSTMPGVFLRMLAHPQTYVAAHICDHPKAGVWTEFVTRYTDGSTHSMTNLAPTGMDHPNWFRKIQAERGTPTNQLYREFLTRREWHGIKPVAPEDSIREFEENYAKLSAWRQDRGVTPEEVAHVAVKWAHQKQAAGTSH